ncbi:MAG: Ribonuclease 3 [Candidatus Woesebacteria bacterium GW2011_GWB1_38_5b]|uniref:Ribonuclease 3 n=1 Tax=Candidatus Woesebacteria bacterium GW2011_GWB1_38_5b TaxID=1618569 RepID=A0A0G0K8R6_9BACT|nr:MAG: Ribonuclease 3 [Candidatus Woesebacteria bacterium GW2011_GWB1_38_5b]OGH47498.1 MAG: ribonuclease III [Candidatus Levybacteria bacterium RIFCSPLOWO2_01_FULL_39_10]
MKKLPAVKDKKLLTEALTHRSYLNESKDEIESNERLEFLGDSILSFVVSKYLFKNFPHLNEGKLTNLRSQLVNTIMLAALARQVELGKLLKLSKGEEDSGGRQNQSILADVFEAYIGALFLDRGTEETEKFINQTVIAKVDEIIKNNLLKDPKSMLQELVQSKKQGNLNYQVLEEKGPAHAKEFTIGVFIDAKLLAKGDGRSKQKAEEKAAKAALDAINS